jgi:hypothetical protein
LDLEGLLYLDFLVVLYYQLHQGYPEHLVDQSHLENLVVLYYQSHQESLVDLAAL